MGRTLNIIKVALMIFWGGVVVGFGLYVFFGAAITNLINSSSAIVNFKEYMGFTQHNVETFIIFWIIAMVPVSFLIFKLNDRNSVAVRAKIAPVKIAKPKTSAKVKAPMELAKPSNVVIQPKIEKVKRIPSKGIGLTGLIIK